MGAGLRRAFAAAKATRAPVWCVKNRDGWCATKNGKPNADDAWNVATKCARFTIGPLGSEKRVPTCIECVEKMSER